jgi:hypothetical protein
MLGVLSIHRLSFNPCVCFLLAGDAVPTCTLFVPAAAMTALEPAAPAPAPAAAAAAAAAAAPRLSPRPAARAKESMVGAMILVADYSGQLRLYRNTGYPRVAD